MDTATHALVPYALTLLVLGAARADATRAPDASRDRLALAAVVAVAAAAPDLDGLLDFLKHRDGLWWLQHRGVTHSLLGAPVAGFAAAGALALAALRFPRRLGAFRPRKGWALAVVLGAWSHLALDAITLAGVPALWPFTTTRVAFPLYHWLVPWLLVPSAGVLALRAWGKLTPRRAAQAGALVVLALVVIGGARAAAYPWDAPADARVYPRPDHREWIVVEPAGDNAWTVRLLASGEVTENVTFEGTMRAQAAGAVERARDSDAYRGFAMGAYGPVVVDTTLMPDDAWLVTFTAVAQRFEATHDPVWTPTKPHSEWGAVTVIVHPEGTVDAVHRGW